MSEIRKSIMDTIGPLVGIAIAIVVILTIAAMGIIGATNSANLYSATLQIGSFVVLIGLGIGLGVFLRVLGKI